jgi:hypothetical protein
MPRKPVHPVRQAALAKLDPPGLASAGPSRRRPRPTRAPSPPSAGSASRPRGPGLPGSVVAPVFGPAPGRLARAAAARPDPGSE